MTFLRVLQVTLTALCSTIISTLLQVFLVTFTALCCTVSTTLFQILHVLNFGSFVHYFSPDLSCSCHGFVLHCQHGFSLTFLIIRLLFVSFLLIVCYIVQLLEYCMHSLSYQVHMFTLVKIT